MITDDRDACYEALKSRDSRFDGRFFVGITSTGIYCRPVCRARLPRKENCVFFRTSAEAESAGFRPCLLCRPEQAPGSSPMDASSALARRAARLIRDTAGENLSLEDVAEMLGCGTRHLRRVFFDAWHVTPVAYLQTCRLLIAKQLLTDTDLSVIDVAMASGFGSVRRMNELFRSRYRLSPTRLREEAPGGGRRTDLISVSVGYRPPFAWESLLSFLGSRAIRGVEQVRDGGYERTVRLRDRDGKVLTGWLRVEREPERNALRLSLPDTLAPVFPQVVAGVRSLFDTDADPTLIASRLKGMEETRNGLFLSGVRVPGCFDPFETAVREVLDQEDAEQTTNTLASRVARCLGTPVATGREGLDRVFPSAEEITSLAGSGRADDGKRNLVDILGKLGIAASRAHCIASLARAVAGGRIHLSRFADPEEEAARLREIPGIGGRTTQAIAMRTMGWTDAFPVTDDMLQRILPELPEERRKTWAAAWKPWRSYAAVSIWNCLE